MLIRWLSSGGLLATVFMTLLEAGFGAPLKSNVDNPSGEHYSRTFGYNVKGRAREADVSRDCQADG